MYYSEITERIERCAWEHLHKLSQEEYVDHSDLDKMKDWRICPRCSCGRPYLTTTNQGNNDGY